MRNVSPRFDKTPNHINLDRVEMARGFLGKIFFFPMNIYLKRWVTTIVETRGEEGGGGHDRQFRYVIRSGNPLNGKTRRSKSDVQFLRRRGCRTL